MKAAAMVVAGWLVPGGGYLVATRYGQFALFLTLICGMFAAGLALHGSNVWPRAEELQGLDGLSARIAQAGALTKWLAGGRAEYHRGDGGRHKYVYAGTDS
jgi:hypothetical protein